MTRIEAKTPSVRRRRRHRPVPDHLGAGPGRTPHRQDWDWRDVNVDWPPRQRRRRVRWVVGRPGRGRGRQRRRRSGADRKLRRPARRGEVLAAATVAPMAPTAPPSPAGQGALTMAQASRCSPTTRRPTTPRTRSAATPCSPRSRPGPATRSTRASTGAAGGGGGGLPGVRPRSGRTYYIPRGEPRHRTRWFVVQVANAVLREPEEGHLQRVPAVHPDRARRAWQNAIEPYLLPGATAPRIAVGADGLATAVTAATALAVAPGQLPQVTAASLDGTAMPGAAAEPG